MLLPFTTFLLSYWSADDGPGYEVRSKLVKAPPGPLSPYSTNGPESWAPGLPTCLSASIFGSGGPQNFMKRLSAPEQYCWLTINRIWVGLVWDFYTLLGLGLIRSWGTVEHDMECDSICLDNHRDAYLIGLEAIGFKADYWRTWP